MGGYFFVPVYNGHTVACKKKKLAILAFSLIKEALAEHESIATPLNAWHQTKEDQGFLKRYYMILYYKGLQSCRPTKLKSEKSLYMK